MKGSVYAGDFAGNVYSVNEANGRLNWEVNVGGSVSASILVTDNTVIFGDDSGNVWGLNASTGATKWEVQPNTSSPYGSVFGSATLIGKDVAIAFASNEENVPGLTTYQENGSLALLNPNNGHVIWETYTIPQAAYAAGWAELASGAPRPTIRPPIRFTWEPAITTRLGPERIQGSRMR